jgi:hypothetical protein
MPFLPLLRFRNWRQARRSNSIPMPYLTHSANKDNDNIIKEDDVGDKNCHFTQLSPGRCDKYCHAKAAGRGVTVDMECSVGVVVKAEWRGRRKPQTVTFPWWVPKTERITSEISPSVA